MAETRVTVAAGNIDGDTLHCGQYHAEHDRRRGRAALRYYH